ncbi:hypothetical protein [Neobacillus jeddahensis]|uniref:hypothetical protein n=1 Tax=Neobacillus jeddahensis TaxID=1461580 RepID=UPI00058B8E84|nr:hypothetical protein [Neobacillus jeddahensis]
MTKQAVQFSKKRRTTYRFQKVKLCKKCNRYSVLKDEYCPACGSLFIGVETLGNSLSKRRLFTEVSWIILFVSIGVFFAPTRHTLYYSLIVGLIFCLTYIVLTFVFMKSEYFHELKKLLRVDLKKIKTGIWFDSDLAKEDVKAERLADGYDKLREIGDFIKSDAMKQSQVMVLNRIALRSDMELELEGLIPTSYDKHFVKYALEVLKINRTLMTKKCIVYFIRYRDAIVVDFGIDSLLSVACMTLRMKLYILEFSEFIEEYLDYFPKERVLRLYSIIYSNPDIEWGSLAEKTKRVVAMKYYYDPDFKPFMERKQVLTN